MTAWENLKALSALAVGTAWQLITSPKLGGTGVVVNDGIAVEVPIDAFTVELSTPEVTVETAPAVSIELASTVVTAELGGAIVAELNLNPVELELPQ